MMLSNLATFALILAQTESGGERWWVEKWIMGTAHGACSAMAFYGDSLLYISYNYRLNEVSVAFTDNSFKSLKKGEKRSVRTIFATPVIDDAWGQSEFVVKIDEKRVAYLRGYFEDDFLDYLPRYEVIGFFYGDTLIQSYKLEGSGKMVAELRKCARDESRRNPTDPSK